MHALPDFDLVVVSSRAEEGLGGVEGDAPDWTCAERKGASQRKTNLRSSSAVRARGALFFCRGHAGGYHVTIRQCGGRERAG